MLKNEKIEQLKKQTRKYAMYLIETGEETDVVDWSADVCKALDALRWRDPVKEPPKPYEALFVMRLANATYQPYAVRHTEPLNGKSYEYLDVVRKIYENYEVDAWRPLEGYEPTVNKGGCS